MPRTKKKNQRQPREYETIELCFRPAQFRRVRQAAALKGISVYDFIDCGVSSAEAAAIKIIEAAELRAKG